MLVAKYLTKLILCLMLVPCIGFSQSGIVSGGRDIKSQGGSISHSIGQAFFQVKESMAGTLWEGLQHPWETLVITSVNESDDGFSPNIKLYPNPTRDYLIIDNQAFQDGHYTLIIYNMSGSIIKEYKLNSAREIISLIDLPNGVYLIRISDMTKHTFNNTYKIVKSEL